MYLNWRDWAGLACCGEQAVVIEYVENREWMEAGWSDEEAKRNIKIEIIIKAFIN